MTLQRPAPSEYDARYAKYIDLVPETDLPLAMFQQLEETRRLVTQTPANRIDVPFAAGEWTVCEILGHLLDTERIFGYRLLCFARGDALALPRADQEMYVRNGKFDRYLFSDLLQEFELIRRSHISMFQHLPAEAWDRTGVIGDLPISVRAIAFVMLGHERHHLETIRTKYMRNGA
jgi:hypothetical protein